MVLAARTMGPGKARLMLVKLAHHLDRMDVETGPRVLRWEESFVMQMDDFEKFLERQLRRMLDPVVAAPPPPRGLRFDRTPKAVPAAKPAVTAPVTVAVIPIPQQ